MRLEYCLRAKSAIWGVFVGPIGLSFLPIENNTKKLVVRILLKTWEVARAVQPPLNVASVPVNST